MHVSTAWRPRGAADIQVGSFRGCSMAHACGVISYGHMAIWRDIIWRQCCRRPTCAPGPSASCFAYACRCLLLRMPLCSPVTDGIRTALYSITCTERGAPTACHCIVSGCGAYSLSGPCCLVAILGICLCLTCCALRQVFANSLAYQASRGTGHRPKMHPTAWSGCPLGKYRSRQKNSFSQISDGYGMLQHTCAVDNQTKHVTRKPQHPWEQHLLTT